jgi:hypothetical protein
MTTQPAAQPAAPVRRAPAITLRGVISILETAAFIIATILAALGNGSDTRNAVITALVGASTHAINHNAGGSPL